jgi:hypothetical protein
VFLLDILSHRMSEIALYNNYAALALASEALELGYWRVLLSLSLGVREAQVFTVSTVLGSTEGERLAGRATFLTPRRNVFP